VIITYVHSSYPADQFRVQMRCRNFADAVNRLGWHTANLLDINSFVQNTPEAQNICAESDLLIIHRYLYGPVLRAVQYWKARDKKVVIDFDQAINFLTPELSGYSFWMEGVPLEDGAAAKEKTVHFIDPTPLEQFKWGLGLVDAAIVPSSRLADDWARYTNVFEIQDYLNTDHYPALMQNHKTELWIGLGYSISESSLHKSGLIKALENICHQYSQVKLVLCNLDPVQVERLNIPASQVKVYAAVSFEDWANILPSLDIGLAPIFGDYDVRSSWITVLEYMVSKIPWVASNLAYRTLAPYGTLVTNSTRDWEIALNEAVDNLDAYRRKAAGEPFLFALSQDVNGNIDKVLKLYTTILNQA